MMKYGRGDVNMISHLYLRHSRENGNSDLQTRKVAYVASWSFSVI